MAEPYNYIMIDKVLDEIERLSRLDKSLDTYEKFELLNVVSDEWKDDFQTFQEWSMNNGYRDELSIDRINNDKGYSPDNCRWTTSVEQNRNKRVHKNSRSGVSGVQWQKQNKKWIAVINTGDKSLGRIHLGSFSRIDEAIRVRRDAELKYWGHTKITSEQIEEIYNPKENFSKAKEDTH